MGTRRVPGGFPDPTESPSSRAGSGTMRWTRRHPGRALDAYLDGELDGPEGDRVAAHVARCLLCRQRAATTRRIRRSLRTMASRI